MQFDIVDANDLLFSSRLMDSIAISAYELNGTPITLEKLISMKSGSSRERAQARQVLRRGVKYQGLDGWEIPRFYKSPVMRPSIDQVAEALLELARKEPTFRLALSSAVGVTYHVIPPQTLATPSIIYHASDGELQVTTFTPGDYHEDFMYLDYADPKSHTWDNLAQYEVFPPNRSVLGIVRRKALVAKALSDEEENPLVMKYYAKLQDFYQELVGIATDNAFGSGSLDGSIGRLKAVLDNHARTSFFKGLCASCVDIPSKKPLLKQVSRKADMSSGSWADWVDQEEVRMNLPYIIGSDGIPIFDRAAEEEMSFRGAFRYDALQRYTSILDAALSNPTQLPYFGSSDPTFVDAQYSLRFGRPLIEVNPSASAGPIIREKHKDIGIGEFTLTKQVMGKFSRSDWKTSVFKYQRTPIQLTKAVPKNDVYSVKKLHTRERLIYATNTFYYNPLSMVLKAMYRSSIPIDADEDASNGVVVNSRVRLLYPFSAANEGAEKILKFAQTINEFRPVVHELIAAVTPFKALVYADNVYLIRYYKVKGEEMPFAQWISLDGSAMESSSSTVMAAYEFVRLTRTFFKLKVSVTACQQLISKLLSAGDYARRKEVAAKAQLPRVVVVNDAVAHNLEAIEEFITTLQLDNPDRLFDDIGSSPETGPSVTKAWLRYLFKSLYDATNSIAYLRRTQFIVPGLASGTSATFHFNTCRMVLVADLLCPHLDAHLDTFQFGNLLSKDFELHPLINRLAGLYGVKLTGELFCSGRRCPLSFHQDLPDGTYQLDLLGYDMTILTFSDVQTRCLTLNRERLLKSIIFSKTLGNKVTHDVVDLILEVVKARTLYLVGGWADPFISDLLISIVRVNWELLGRRIPPLEGLENLIPEFIRAMMMPGSTSEQNEFLVEPGQLKALMDLRPETLVPSLTDVFSLSSSTITMEAFLDDVYEAKAKGVEEIYGLEVPVDEPEVKYPPEKGEFDPYSTTLFPRSLRAFNLTPELRREHAPLIEAKYQEFLSSIVVMKVPHGMKKLIDLGVTMSLLLDRERNAVVRSNLARALRIRSEIVYDWWLSNVDRLDKEQEKLRWANATVILEPDTLKIDELENFSRSAIEFQKYIEESKRRQLAAPETIAKRIKMLEVRKRAAAPVSSVKRNLIRQAERSNPIRWTKYSRKADQSNARLKKLQSSVVYDEEEF